MKRFTFCVLPLAALLFSASWIPDACERGQPTLTALGFPLVVTYEAAPSLWMLDLPKVTPAPLARQEIVEVGLIAPRSVRFSSQTILRNHAPRGPPLSADECFSNERRLTTI